MIIFLSGFFFGAFVIPFGIQAGMASWLIFLVVTVAQLVRTYIMYGVGVAASGTLQRRAARRGRQYPPAAVTRVADIAKDRGLRTAGLVAPWILASTAGLLIAVAAPADRGRYIGWIMIGTAAKFAVFTAAWVVAIVVGGALAEQYVSR